MIPKFKAGDAGSAIYEGVHACSKRIIGVGKLAVAPKLPEITAEQPVVTAEKPIEADAILPRSSANAGSSGANESDSSSKNSNESAEQSAWVASMLTLKTKVIQIRQRISPIPLRACLPKPLGFGHCYFRFDQLPVIQVLEIHQSQDVPSRKGSLVHCLGCWGWVALG